MPWHWFPSPPRVSRAEFLDEPHKFAQELPDNLRDMRRLNRWFGGLPPVLLHLRGLVSGEAELRLLDVGTGSADIPLAISRWAARHGTKVHVTGLDSSRDVLDEAAKTIVAEVASVELFLGDARKLPFPANSFDVVICNLALHHFSPGDACVVMREMWRVTSGWILVTDLRRSYLAYGAAWLASRTIARNKLTRHDAPLSVLRAYTSVELRTMAIRSGIEPFRMRNHAFFRQALVAKKGDCRSSVGASA